MNYIIYITNTHTGDLMAQWKDPRKNIYTVTVVNRRHGYIAHIETHSNKKKAEDRHARLNQLYVIQKRGHDDELTYEVELHTTKLQRKTRWE